MAVKYKHDYIGYITLQNTFKDIFHERKFGVGIRFDLMSRTCPSAGDAELRVFYRPEPTEVQRRIPCSDCR